MPRHWWPSLDAISAVIESDGPWPSPSPQSNGTFLPLDVDEYGGLAIVVGYGLNRDGEEVLGVDEFQKAGGGGWNHLGGAGGGHSLDERRQVQDPNQALHLRMSGSSGEFPLEPERKAYSFAIFLCGPQIATVETHRLLGTRIADVSAGPGWVGVLWVPEDPARLSAYTADGVLSFSWNSPDRGPA